MRTYLTLIFVLLNSFLFSDEIEFNKTNSKSPAVTRLVQALGSNETIKVTDIGGRWLVTLGEAPSSPPSLAGIELLLSLTTADPKNAALRQAAEVYGLRYVTQFQAGKLEGAPGKLLRQTVAAQLGISTATLENAPEFHRFLLANGIHLHLAEYGDSLTAGRYGIPILTIKGKSYSWPDLKKQFPIDPATGKLKGMAYTTAGFQTVAPSSPPSTPSQPPVITPPQPPVTPSQPEPPPIDIEKEYGNKYLNLLRLHEITKGIPGVEVPLPQGISSKDSHAFLQEHALFAVHLWELLGEQFKEYQKIATPDNWSAFIDVPEVDYDLKVIEEVIKEAYRQASEKEAALLEMGITLPLQKWLNEINTRGGYLMVRSSGAEDSQKLANAGGNLSLAYVAPTPSDVAKAIGRVLASYFSPTSLKNRLNSGDNPFEGESRLSVTVMELIGEPVGGAQNFLEVPVSMVLFTNEPLYTNGTFRIMRISSSYGHGEAVVNNLGLAADTFLLVDSAKEPLIFSQIGKKSARLVPEESLGKISLEKRPNEPSVIEKPSLSPALLQRLYTLGTVVENAYGYPMDMEIVVKGETIYPVQARPVNRPPLKPTYLDMPHLAKTSPSPLSEMKRGEVVVVGTAQVGSLASAHQILSAATLEKAQELFKKSEHKLVLIQQEEPANSHPVVNFSSWGIPVFYFANGADTEALLAKITPDTPLVFDSQAGVLGIWDSKVALPEAFIKQGYLVHPASVSISLEVPSYLQNKKKHLKDVSELTPLIQEVRDVCFSSSRETALKQLRQLPPLIALQEALNTVQGKISSSRTALSAELIDKMHEAFEQALAQWEAAPLDPELRCHFHSKVVESVLRDWLPLATEEAANLENMVHYQSSFITPPLFTEQASYVNATLDEPSAKAWIAFLTELDLMLQRFPNTAVAQDIETFQNNLRLYDELGILPQWMFLVFNPLYHTRTNLSQNTPDELKNFFGHVLSELSPEVKGVIEMLGHHRERLDSIYEQLELFSDPKTFSPAWASLKTAIDPFWDERPLLDQLKESSPLVKAVASGTLNRVIETMDGGIKQMLMSPLYTDQQKVDHLQEMLDSLLDLFIAWSIYFIPNEVVPPWKTVTYLNTVKKAFDQTGNGPEQLLPTPGFIVSNSLIDSTSAKYVLPQAKEGFFTLFHQNLLSVLQIYTAQAFAGQQPVSFPPLINGVQNEQWAKKGPTKIEVTSSALVLAYNIPLREHSATVNITYNKQTQSAEMGIHFFGGTELGRWEVIEVFAKFIEKITGITEARPPQRDPESGIAIFWKTSTPEQVKEALKAVSSMERITYAFAWPFSAKNYFSSTEKIFQDPRINPSDALPYTQEALAKALVFADIHFLKDQENRSQLWEMIVVPYSLEKQIHREALNALKSSKESSVIKGQAWLEVLQERS